LRNQRRFRFYELYGDVILTPFDDAFDLTDRREEIFIEASVPKSSVEALDVGILHGFSGTDEVELHAFLARSGIERRAGELGAPTSQNWPLSTRSKNSQYVNRWQIIALAAFCGRLCFFDLKAKRNFTHKCDLPLFVPSRL